MDILQTLKDYRMKRFFSNNCPWTKECKEEYKTLMSLIWFYTNSSCIYKTITPEQV